ncbi:MAG: CHAT domain-containing protein [Alphaproteobacteria bacterium]|nr:CHAT domain-containing protein [Alphaproteobacteria bacterium]
MKCKIVAAVFSAALLLGCQQDAAKPVTSNTAGATAIARAQNAFVAPPRSIADVIERLERELAQRRPDAATMLDDSDPAEADAEDEAAPAAVPRAPGAAQNQQRGRQQQQQQQQPQGALRVSPAERIEADRASYSARADEARRAANDARRDGKIDAHLALAREALALARQGQPRNLFNYLILAAHAETDFGVRPRGYALFIEAADAAMGMPNPRPGFVLATDAARVLAQGGRREDARKMLDRAESLRTQLGARRGLVPFMPEFEARLSFARGLVDLGEGKLEPAEAHLRVAIARMERMVASVKAGLDAKPGFHENQLALYRQQLANLLNDQQRFVEAEIYARQSLQAMIDLHGPYHVTTVFRIQALTRTLVEQGRFAEARRLATVSMGIQREMKIAGAANSYLGAHIQLAASRLWQADYAGALGEYRRMLQAIGEGNANLAERWVTATMNYGVALLMTGDAVSARKVLDVNAERVVARYGVDAFGAAMARGFRALSVARAGDTNAALTELDAIAPVLERGPAGDAASSDANGAVANRMRRVLIEEIVALYADLAAKGQGDAAEKAFRLADVARGLSVQGAIAQMSSRAGAGDPALEDAIRREQDLAQQVQATRAILADASAAPAEQRDANVEAQLRAQATAQDAERKRLADDIARRFPDYAQLRFPRPPTTAETQQALKPDEAMLAFFVGQRASYVWAVRQGQAPRFAAVAMGDAQIADDVKALRAALDPNAATLADIPAFDTARSHKLYTALVAPVAASLSGARAIVAVPHGPLGQLPLGVLTTKPGSPRAVSNAPMFAEYRDASWLVRDYAVLQVPSASALRALRGLRAPAAGRREFAGFGDPQFSPQAMPAQTASAGQVATRGARLVRRNAPVVDAAASARLADLPPLPDTADEVMSVANALHADPARDVFLGARASERGVREADLIHRRFVMFATHGLVPGDLDGLVQPALALSAPEVSGGEGDGLLTMEKILRLKLDADWVVLSACNTASGDGEGAEAISGLGRAFFYAGARALLVTSWPVETVSARTLTTDLFARQAADPKLDRATALRQSMLGLIGTGPEGAGFVYAHPIFWAPFLLVGDGG